jgi:hypothetical protein
MRFIAPGRRPGYAAQRLTILDLNSEVLNWSTGHRRRCLRAGRARDGAAASRPCTQHLNAPALRRAGRTIWLRDIVEDISDTPFAVEFVENVTTLNLNTESKKREHDNTAYLFLRTRSRCRLMIVVIRHPHPMVPAAEVGEPTLIRLSRERAVVERCLYALQNIRCFVPDFFYLKIKQLESGQNNVAPTTESLFKAYQDFV